MRGRVLIPCRISLLRQFALAKQFVYSWMPCDFDIFIIFTFMLHIIKPYYLKSTISALGALLLVNRNTLSESLAEWNLLILMVVQLFPCLIFTDVGI